MGDYGIYPVENVPNKVLVVDTQGNLIYPDTSRDSGVDPGKRSISRRSSVALKDNHFKVSSKQLRRSRKNASIKLSCDVIKHRQMLQSSVDSNSKLKSRSVLTQTDPESQKTCQCQENRRATTASGIGDSKALTDEDVNKFERFYFKQQPKDDYAHVTAFLTIIILIFLLLLVCCFWNSGKHPIISLWDIFRNFHFKRKQEVSKFAIIFKFIGKLFGR